MNTNPPGRGLLFIPDFTRVSLISGRISSQNPGDYLLARIISRLHHAAMMPLNRRAQSKRSPLRLRQLSLLALFSALLLPNANAQPADASIEKPFSEGDWVDDRWSRTEVGQFLHNTVETPHRKTPKAITINIGDNNEAAVCFDTDLLRYAAAWTGGFIKLSPVRYGLMASAAPAGEIQFTTKPGPGWAKNSSFDDPRPQKLGALPRDWAKYKGLYLSGDNVVLSYTVGAASVLEMPQFQTIAQMPVFVRHITIEAEPSELLLHIADLPGTTAIVTNLQNISIGLLRKDGFAVAAAILSRNSEVEIVPNGTALNARIRAQRSPAFVKVLVAKLPVEDLPDFARHAGSRPASFFINDLHSFTQGGPPRWPALTTTGHVDRSDSPLAIDTITMPYENPWNALLFASGHDFFSDGDAAVATAHGDVWRVSGLDDSLQKITWKRFATGLYQPLGLKIINDKVHVLERDQITILHDLNNNGEADYYENFNNDTISGGGVHAYATCLETDSAGNFYFAKCSENTPHGGTVMKVSRDGSGVEVVATGFRYPNGLGIGPADFITVADQQGEWVPETRLNLIQPGGFYGYMPSHHRATAPTTYDPPLCWIPRALDNSAGGQVWVPENHWGPLAGQMLHLSYGRCTMMLILRDESSPASRATPPRSQPLQGAVVPLPARFASGICRGRFNSHDGHLYLTGMRGWQTAAVRDGCFQRVRYRKPLPLPANYSVSANSISITFSEPLDRELAEDPESYSAEMWNYRWASKYGSADYSVKNPEKEGRDNVKITSVRLGEDGKTIHLTIPNLRPAMQLAINYNLETATGTPVQSALYATLNHVPPK